MLIHPRVHAERVTRKTERFGGITLDLGNRQAAVNGLQVPASGQTVRDAALPLLPGYDGGRARSTRAGLAQRSPSSRRPSSRRWRAGRAKRAATWLEASSRLMACSMAIFVYMVNQIV